MDKALLCCQRLLDSAESAPRGITGPPGRTVRLQFLEEALSVYAALCTPQPKSSTKIEETGDVHLAPGQQQTGSANPPSEKTTYGNAVGPKGLQVEEAIVVESTGTGVNISDKGEGAYQQLMTNIVKSVHRALSLSSDSIFSDESGRPCQPPQEMQSMLEEHLRAACLYFQIYGWVVKTIPTKRLEPPERVEDDSYVAPITVLEEVPPEEPGDVRVGTEILVDCCLYGLDDMLQVPWTSQEVGDYVDCVLGTWGQRLEGSHLQGLKANFSPQFEQENARVGHELSSSLLQEHVDADDRHSRSRSHDTIGRDGTKEELLVRFIPEIRDTVRLVLSKRRLRDAHERIDFSPMPSAFECTAAAKTFTWMVCQLGSAALVGHTLDLVVPTVCAIVDDPSQDVQVLGLACLHHLVREASRKGLLAWREVVLQVVQGAIIGAEVDLWEALFPLATDLVIKLEGSNPRQPGYDVVMKSLLKEIERGSHDARKRLIFMTAVCELAQPMGLILVKYFSRLLPLLLEWADAQDVRSRRLAVQTLSIVVKQTWPRIPAHSIMLWDVLQKVYDQESDPKAGRTGCDELKSAIEALSVSLVRCSGDTLTGHLETLRIRESPQDKRLIHVVLAALEGGDSDTFIVK